MRFQDWGKAAPTPRNGFIGSTPTGTPETIKSSDKQDKQDAIRFQIASGNALAAAGYQVEWQPEVLPSDNIAPNKKPDMRLGDNIADVVAPTSSSPEQVRRAISGKVSSGQAYHIVLNLGRTNVTLNQVEALLARKLIAGLQELIVIEKDRTITRLLPDPEQISPISSSLPPQAP